jgi:hypothetical protein
MEAQMKIVPVVMCLCLLGGCGMSSMPSTANNVLMKGGQWEFAVKAEDGAAATYYEANLPATNVGFNVPNAEIFQPLQWTVPNTEPIFCSGYFLDGNISGAKLDGKIAGGFPLSHFASFSGELDADGQSISTGQYSGGTCRLNGTVNTTGSFTGYTVPPLNGMFTGTLTSSLHGVTVVAISITQNDDFTITATGTSVENGVTSALASLPGQDSIVLGATTFFGGTATNVNGSPQFGAFGHLNPLGTQLMIEIDNTTDSITGTLTKH